MPWIDDRAPTMISVEGAGLIAQILQLLLLVGAVERRALGPVVTPPKGAPLRKRRLAWIFLNIMTIALAFLVEFICIAAVATDVRLDLLRAIPVVIVMLTFGIVITFTLLDLYLASLIGIESYRERQADSDKRQLIKLRAVRVARIAKRIRD